MEVEGKRGENGTFNYIYEWKIGQERKFGLETENKATNNITSLGTSLNCNST
jgi:hypothetical protein